MRKRLAMLLFLVAVPCLALGQTTPPPTAPATQNFVITVDAANYNNQKGNQAVMLVGASARLTTNFSAGYLAVTNPMDSQQPRYHLGVVNYTRGLEYLLGSKLTSKLAFDASNYFVTFGLGAGKVTSPGVNRIAESASIHLTRPVANNMSMTAGVLFLRPGNVVVKVPSVGINITF